MSVKNQYEEFSQRQKFLLSEIKLFQKNLQAIVSTESETYKVKTKNLNQITHKLENDSFKVLVIGEFKRGKSTFINALLSDEILPAYATPCTAIINEIKWGGEKKVKLFFRDSIDKIPNTIPQRAKDHILKHNKTNTPPIEINIEDIEKYVTITDPSMDQEDSVAESPYKVAHIHWPLELCKNGIEIIDSPGLNEHGTRTEVTKGYLDNADAILFVMSSQALASQSEMQVLENDIAGRGHKDIFFIVNRFDQVRKRERERVKEFAWNKLLPFTELGKNGVFFLSALDALEGRLDNEPELVEESGILPLEQKLENFLTQERGKLKLQQPTYELNKMIAEAVDKTIPQQSKMLQTGLQELEEKYNQSLPHLHAAERHQANILVKMNQNRHRTENSCRYALQSFQGKLMRQIPEWLDPEVYTPKTEISMFSPKEGIKKLGKEVSAHLERKINKFQNKWQKEEFQPLLDREIEMFTQEVSTSVEKIVANIDLFSQSVSGQTPNNDDISPVERVLSAAGGFIIGGAGSAFVGATMGKDEMLKSLAPQIMLAVGMIFFGLTNPFILIPALLSGGLLQGFLKKGAISKKAVSKIGEQFVEELSKNQDQVVNEGVQSISESLQQMIDSIDNGLTAMVQQQKDQVDLILQEKKSKQEDVDNRILELDQLGQHLASQRDKLMQFTQELNSST